MRRFSLRGCMPAALIVCLSLAALAPFNCAWAQAAAPGTTVDLSPIVQWLLGLLAAAGTGLAGMATTWLYAKFGISKNSLADTAVQAAMAKGGALAYSFLASQGAKVTDVTLKNQALATGLAFVTAQVPKQLATLGITPASAAAHVEAEFGKLLAADPTVSVAASSPAAAPAPAARS